MLHHLHYKDIWTVFSKSTAQKLIFLQNLMWCQEQSVQMRLLYPRNGTKTAKKMCPISNWSLHVSFRDKQVTDLLEEEITKMILKGIFFIENIQ